MANDAERAEELAANESLEILFSALYSALEADLSGLGWPNGSKISLAQATVQMESLIRVADRG